MFLSGCHKNISFLSFFLFSFHYAICVPKERENRHLFPLLGYMHGYKIGQNFAYQLPTFVISPVVVVPSVNQQQSVNVQKSTAGENYQENGGTFQIISPSKLTMKLTDANLKDNESERTEIKQTSNVVILENTDLSTETNILNSDLDTFRQVPTNDTATTDVYSGTTEEDDENVTLTTDDIYISEVENLKVTHSYGPYPTAVYKNKNISTLSITTATPLTNTSMNAKPLAQLLQNNLTLPHLEKHHTFNKDNSNEHADLSSNNDNVKENSNTSTVKVPFLFRGYSYRNPWHNSVADKLSITTNSRTNYEPPLPFANDDRWQSFSSLRKYPTSDFRPLAGLYHDGFLHRYLVKNRGFVPVNNH